MGFQREHTTADNAEPVQPHRFSHTPMPSSHWVREETRPDVIARLEALDDVIFAAIDGDPAALQESEIAWHNAVNELGHDAIEETRRQYLRHAQGVWECLRQERTQQPQKIFAAIEIIGLLVNAER